MQEKQELLGSVRRDASASNLSVGTVSIGSNSLSAGETDGDMSEDKRELFKAQRVRRDSSSTLGDENEVPEDPLSSYPIVVFMSKGNSAVLCNLAEWILSFQDVVLPVCV